MSKRVGIVILSLDGRKKKFKHPGIELSPTGIATTDDSKMATKQPLKTTFDVEHVIRPIFTGGSVGIDNAAQILATTIAEDVVLTNPANGKHLGQIEGVRFFPLIIAKMKNTK